MRKLSIFALATAFSMNAFAVTVDKNNSVDVDASVDVAAPSALSASWTKVPTLNTGLQAHGTKIGTMNVSNLDAANAGWVIYTDGSASTLSNGYTKYTFSNVDGSSITARVFAAEYAGVTYGQGTAVGTGPITFIPSQHSSVDFKLDETQRVNAGTYSATLSVASYNQ